MIHLKNVAMFFIAPIIGGLYAAFFPIVATALIAIIGVDALVKKLDKKLYVEVHAFTGTVVS